MSATGEKKARSIRAQLFLFTPCIEGFFLRLLKQNMPPDTDSCKRKFHEVGLGEQEKLQYEGYQKLFPTERFSELNADAQFAKLMALFSNRVDTT